MADNRDPHYEHGRTHYWHWESQLQRLLPKRRDIWKLVELLAAARCSRAVSAGSVLVWESRKSWRRGSWRDDMSKNGQL